LARRSPPKRTGPPSARADVPLRARCRCTRAEMRGWSTTRTRASATRTGTIVSKAVDGRVSSSIAPASPPAAAAIPSRSTRRRWPASSRRYPMAPLTDPGISPSALDTVAVTGGSPVASSTGNVIRVPDPTMVLMVPAPIPAAKTASDSQMDNAISFTIAWTPPRRARSRGRTDHARGEPADVEGCPAWRQPRPWGRTGLCSGVSGASPGPHGGDEGDEHGRDTDLEDVADPVDAARVPHAERARESVAGDGTDDAQDDGQPQRDRLTSRNDQLGQQTDDQPRDEGPEERHGISFRSGARFGLHSACPCKDRVSIRWRNNSRACPRLDCSSSRWTDSLASGPERLIRGCPRRRGRCR